MITVEEAKRALDIVIERESAFVQTYSSGRNFIS